MSARNARNRPHQPQPAESDRDLVELPNFGGGSFTGADGSVDPHLHDFRAFGARPADAPTGVAHKQLQVYTVPVTPMAVIGLAGRLPGGIDSPDLLWEALLRGEDQITAPVGASRIWHSEN